MTNRPPLECSDAILEPSLVDDFLVELPINLQMIQTLLTAGDIHAAMDVVTLLKSRSETIRNV